MVNIGASQEFTGSNGLEGTSLVLGAYTGLRVPIKEYSRFGLAVRYSDRKPINSELYPDTQTFGGSAEYVVGLSPRWALGFGAQYYDQTGGGRVTTDPTDPNAEAFVPDGQYTIFSAVVSWSPNNR